MLLRWVDDAEPAAVEAVLDGLRGLPAAISEICSYVVGTDVGLADGNYDVAVVADFDSSDGYLVYRDHPVHRALIEERIAPILAGRAAVQHDVP